MNPVGIDTPDSVPYYLTPDEAYEASQGAFLQAAWLEVRANDEPNRSKRRELLYRAQTALAVARGLGGVSA